MQSVAQMASKWQRGMQGGTETWNQAIQGYSGNPMEMAAAKVDVAVANYAASAQRMAANLRATPVSVWKSQSAASKANYAQGAAKGLPAYTRALTVLSTNVWPGMKAASQAAGGGPAGCQAAVQYAIDAKAQGRTK